jgi:4-hydroxybenzoate polyprenyltransferase
MGFSSLLIWVRFLRLPAVLTVPGDLWVGAVVAGRSAVAAEIAAVICVYLFGMGFNDWWDRERDAVHRPERPIPSGRLSTRAALLMCTGLGLAAWVLLPSVGIAALLITVILYTLIKTPFPLLGAGVMGCCRMQSVWIGTGADWPASVPEAAVPLGAGVLIFFLTRLAQLEGTGRKGTFRSAVVAVLLVVASVAAVWLGGKQGPISWALLGALVGVAIANHAAIERNGRVPPAAVGIYLALWVPLQALWVLGDGRALEGAVLIAAAVALPCMQRMMPVS